MKDPRTSEGKEPEAQGSDLVRVKFLRVHPDYGYFAEDIGIIPSAAAEDLSQSKSRIEKGILVISEPFVAILPEGWIEPVIEKVVPEPVFTAVRWLEPHKLFGYFKGDIGTVTSENVTMLLTGGFIELITKDENAKISMMDKLKGYLKK